MKEYVQMIHGTPHTVLLTPEEAERRGAVEVEAATADVPTKAGTAQNKARSAENK